MNIDRTFLDVKSPPGSIGGLYLSSKRRLDILFAPQRQTSCSTRPGPFTAFLASSSIDHSAEERVNSQFKVDAVSFYFTPSVRPCVRRRPAPGARRQRAFNEAGAV